MKPTNRWKKIAGTGDRYSVCTVGVVRNDDTGRVLRPGVTLSGYLAVVLVRNGKPTTSRVHGIVAEAFIGPRPAGHVVNHKNGIKIDNRVSNLEYVTPRENSQHAISLGLVSKSRAQYKKIFRPESQNSYQIVSPFQLTADFDRHEFTLDGKQIRLVPAEARILNVLLISDGRLVSRSEICRLSSISTARAVDVIVSRLRKKTAYGLVDSVSGIGYRLGRSVKVQGFDN
jgi:DNA-binding winged helix-turn-helix (wHTH) protein